MHHAAPVRGGHTQQAHPPSSSACALFPTPLQRGAPTAVERPIVLASGYKLGNDGNVCVMQSNERLHLRNALDRRRAVAVPRVCQEVVPRTFPIRERGAHQLPLLKTTSDPRGKVCVDENPHLGGRLQAQQAAHAGKAGECG